MAQLDEIAGTDELTGILNRRRFFEEGRLRLEQSEHYQPSVLCLIDLDHFKVINDSQGHHQGDLVLKEIARLLSERARQSDSYHYKKTIIERRFCLVSWRQR